MRDLRTAIGFLTVLPVAPSATPHMGRARAYFPVVGLALGATLAGLDYAGRLALPSPVVGALLIAALLVLTRAIHVEGFLDCCDGLFGSYTPARRLEILRDTHVGAFAVAGGASLILLKWSLLSGIPGDVRPGLLFVFPCLSRLGMLTTMAVFVYVREQGIGTAFQNGAARWHAPFGVATALVASAAMLGYAGVVLVGGAVIVSLGTGRWISRMLGGMTGDAYGAVNEVTEVAVLLLGVALFTLIPELYGAPLW